MAKRLLVMGAGGHGRAVADLAAEGGWTVGGFTDRVTGASILGRDEDLTALAAAGAMDAAVARLRALWRRHHRGGRLPRRPGDRAAEPDGGEGSRSRRRCRGDLGRPGGRNGDGRSRASSRRPLVLRLLLVTEATRSIGEFRRPMVRRSFLAYAHWYRRAATPAGKRSL